jgi:dehydrogenase/reductase SDR family protein 7
LAYQLAAEDSSTFPPLHLILSSRSEAELQSVAQTCRELSSSCVNIRQTTVTVLPLDVCDDEALHRAVQEVATSSGGAPLDTVVLNAGGGHLSPALETTPETVQAVWRLNAHWPMVLVPLLFRHELLRGVEEQEQGRRRRRLGPHLVVTSSVVGVLPVPLSATYAAAKHALQGYFRSLAAERPDLCLHVIMPGPVATNFHQNHPGGRTNDKTTPTITGAHSNNPKEHKHSNNKFQMPVDRCVRLLRTALRCFPNQSRESWIAAQPVLTALVLHQFVPYAWMHHLVYRRIGPRRLELYRAGDDLYNPASWRRTRTPVNVVPHEKQQTPTLQQARSKESSDCRDENGT